MLDQNVSWTFTPQRFPITLGRMGEVENIDHLLQGAMFCWETLGPGIYMVYHVTKASHPDQMHPRMATTLIGGSDPTLVPATPTTLRRNGKNVTKSSRF